MKKQGFILSPPLLFEQAHVVLNSCYGGVLLRKSVCLNSIHRTILSLVTTQAPNLSPLFACHLRHQIRSRIWLTTGYMDHGLSMYGLIKINIL